MQAAIELLDEIIAIMRSYGYQVAETVHDCGELGGLAQSRKRLLLIARRPEQLPPFIYEPEKKQLRGVGDVLAQRGMAEAAVRVREAVDRQVSGAGTR